MMAQNCTDGRCPQPNASRSQEACVKASSCFSAAVIVVRCLVGLGAGHTSQMTVFSHMRSTKCLL